MGWIQSAINKLNPSQRFIATGGGGATEGSPEPLSYYTQAYERIGVVNRGVNMIVDDAASIPFWVGDQIKGISPVIKGIRKQKVNNLLNFQPNPFQDISTFKRNLLIDYIVDGNIFIYYDGAHLYHLPAAKVEIFSSKTMYIEKYTLNDVDYSPDEIIHIKENSFDSIFRGTSRLRPEIETIQLLLSMKKFRKTFFRNGAVTGLVIKTPDTLSQKIKDRLISSWQEKYNPESGGRTPLVLDGGMEVDKITNTNFKELEFEESIKNGEDSILKCLGVPPVLMNSGNNANLRPNMRLYYLETVMPILDKVDKALERFFGYEITPDTTKISAMQPELNEQASYYSTLTNGGILDANESRKELGYPSKGPEHDELRIPANIAGSAANPSVGGRPSESE